MAKTRKLSGVRDDDRKIKVSRKEYSRDDDGQRLIWVTEDRYTSNLGDELKGWVDHKMYKIVTPMRTKRESMDWVYHLKELREEMVKGDIIVWSLGRCDLAKEQDSRAWEAIAELLNSLPVGLRVIGLGVNERTDINDRGMSGKVNRSIENLNNRVYNVLKKYPLDTLFVPIKGLGYGDYYGLGERTPGKLTRAGLVKVVSALVESIRKSGMVKQGF